MTPKGYLLFEIPEYEGYSRQYEGYRVQPLGEGLRALNQKYVQGLSYSLDGILSCDWSADDSSALNLEQVYEFLYVRFHGSYPSEDYAKTYEEAAKAQARGFICIPADEVEAFMLQHLPLAREQLRRSFPFDKEADAYIHTPYQGGGYSPIPELVCAEEKADGSIVLTVDAVSADFGDDRSMGSLLTVKDNPDGSIRYLSNRVTVPFKS